MWKTSPQVMKLPTAAIENGGGVNRQRHQTGQCCSPISSGGSEMRNTQRGSSLERKQGGDRVSGCCHYPASGFFAVEKGKWFAEVKEPPWAVIPLRGKKCLDFSVSAFSNFYMLMVSFPPSLHHSHNSSMPCPFWQQVPVNVTGSLPQYDEAVNCI